ncbi:MAG: hypothetical protein AABW51_02540 [Nanoarchaeota archaeon]
MKNKIAVLIMAGLFCAVLGYFLYNNLSRNGDRINSESNFNNNSGSSASFGSQGQTTVDSSEAVKVGKRLSNGHVRVKAA